MFRRSLNLLSSSCDVDGLTCNLAVGRRPEKDDFLQKQAQFAIRIQRSPFLFCHCEPFLRNNLAPMTQVEIASAKSGPRNDR